MKNREKSTSTYTNNLTGYLYKIIQKQIPITNPEFLAKIRRFRRKWKIPLQGFKNQKSCRKWLGNPPKEILKYPKIVEQLEQQTLYFEGGFKIVQKLNPKIIEGFKSSKDISKFPIGSFLTDIQVFMFRKNIDSSLIQPLLSFIYYGKIFGSSYPKTIVEVSRREITTKCRRKIEDMVYISFGPNTRQKDILAVWDKQIAPIQEKLLGHIIQKSRNRKTKEKLSS